MIFDEIAHRVSLEVPGAPSMTVKDMILWAMADLCDQGNAWVYEGGPVVVAADTDYAELEAPEGAEPVRVLQVLSDGKPLRPGDHYRQTGPRSIQILTPIKQKSLSGRLAVKPEPGGKIPDAVTSAYSDTLRHGALHKLFMLPQRWQDSERAIYHRRLWQAGVTQAMQRSAYGYQAGGARIRPRRFI